MDEAIHDLSQKITAVSSGAVLKVERISAEEARIRVYAPADDEGPIKDAVLETTLQLLAEHGLDIQVLVYNIATDLPPDA